MTAGVVAPGTADRGLPRSVWDGHRDLAVELLTIGRHHRAGYTHRRPWAGVDWTQYAASVPVDATSGPWRIGMVEVTDDSPTAVVAHAEGMPHAPGWYSELQHERRGLVMSDVPAEIAGTLDFLDRAPRAGPDRRARPRCRPRLAAQARRCGTPRRGRARRRRARRHRW